MRDRSHAARTDDGPVSYLLHFSIRIRSRVLEAAESAGPLNLAPQSGGARRVPLRTGMAGAAGVLGSLNPSLSQGYSRIPLARSTRAVFFSSVASVHTDVYTRRHPSTSQIGCSVSSAPTENAYVRCTCFSCVLKRNHVCFDNDPSEGSPTDTLLRLLLPLSHRTCTSSQHSKSRPKAAYGTNPKCSFSTTIGSSDGRCVQRAGT